MNYIGLIFSFMVPGMIVGGMAVSLVYEYRKFKARQASRVEEQKKERIENRWSTLLVG